jgi:hypothetical protein
MSIFNLAFLKATAERAIKSAFLKATAERAIKSAVQGAITAGIGAAQFDAIHANWETIGGAALSMAILSVATSVLSGFNGGGPSVTNSETLNE